MKYLLFCVPLLFLVSCEDEDPITPDNLTEATAARLAGEVQLLLGGQQLLEQGYGETQVAAQQEEDLLGKSLGGPPASATRVCPAVAFRSDGPDFFPAVLSLDYDDCPTGGKLALGGQIEAVFDGLLFWPGTQIAIGFRDFSANEYAVTGNYVERNDSLDAQGRQQFTKTIRGAQFSRNDTLLFTYEQDVVAYQVEGQQTNFLTDGLDGIFDDRYREEVTGSGVLADGSAFTVTTATPVGTAFGCGYYTSGTLVYTYERSAVPIRLDFGEGSCDDRGILTVGEFSFAIIL